MAAKRFLAFCAAVTAFASSIVCEHASLYLLPDTQQASREIEWDQAVSLVAHTIGLSGGIPGVFPSINFVQKDKELLDDADGNFNILDKPKANMWIVIQDFPTNEKLLKMPPTYQITGQNILGAQLLEFGSNAADTLAQNVPDSWPLVISSEHSLVGTGPASRILINEKVVKMISSIKPSESISSIINEISVTTHKDMEKHAQEKFGADAAIFQSSRAEDAQLMAELEFLTSLFEALKIQQTNDKPKTASEPSFVSVTLSGLKRIRVRYGPDSIEYERAAVMTAKAIEQIVVSFDDIHQGRGALAGILTLPIGTSVGLLRRATTASTSCAGDLGSCIIQFRNCSNRGTCVAKNMADGTVCYQCQCSKRYLDDAGNSVPGFSGSVKWTGDTCEYQDISVPFQILFWTSVALIITLIFVVGLLVSVGSNSADNGVTGGRSKTD